MSGWGAAIAAVVSAGAAAYGQHKANKDAKALRKQQQPLIDLQKQNLQTLQPFGQQLLGQGQGNMDIVQSYLRKLASGDRNLTMQTLAPEINTMAGQQLGSVSAARNLFPRGGANTAATANLPFQLQGNINNMMFGARSQANQQLGQLGGNQASLGLSALGQGSGLTNNMLNYGLNAQGQMFNQGAQIGQGISSMISPFLQYWMMNRQSNPAVNAQLPTKNPYPYGYGNAFTPAASGQSSTLGGGSTPTTASNDIYTSNSNPYSGGK